MGGVTDAQELSAKPRILIIVQNLPVPFDRRVWLECNALTAAGYDVTVVCPKGKNDPGHEVLEGVTLLKYRPYAPGGGPLGFRRGVRRTHSSRPRGWCSACPS